MELCSAFPLNADAIWLFNCGSFSKLYTTAVANTSKSKTTMRRTQRHFLEDCCVAFFGFSSLVVFDSGIFSGTSDFLRFEALVRSSLAGGEELSGLNLEQGGEVENSDINMEARCG